MALLCFVVDLRSLSSPLIRDLKQALLQLANYYAVCTPQNENRPEPLRDRIGLCYFVFNRISSSTEMKVAYCPRGGNFSLRDFHHAVHNLPVDAFCPYLAESSSLRYSEMDLSSLLNDQLLYSWGEKDFVKKVIVLSSCLIGNIESMREVLMEAAEKCVSVEFLLLEQKCGHLYQMSDEINKFSKHICDLENCSFKTCLPDIQALCHLVKRWHRELKDDPGELVQARFTFKGNLFGHVDTVSCYLSVAANQLIDGFAPCQTCRCHGKPVDHTVGNKVDAKLSCPVTGSALGVADVMETSVMVGKKTILYLPSFHSCKSHQQVSQPIDFEIIERTKLASFSEGTIMGASIYVTPSTGNEVESSLDESDKSDLNPQVFLGLSRVLYSLDQGLICSSNCNVETLKEAAYNCYYLLQPSENGPMLLRRIAGSEEILPITDFNQCRDATMIQEIEASINVSLGKMPLRDYNPVLVERGFHQKLNSLVKESLQFGSAGPNSKEEIVELKLCLSAARTSNEKTAVVKGSQSAAPKPKEKTVELKLSQSAAPKPKDKTAELKLSQSATPKPKFKEEKAELKLSQAAASTPKSKEETAELKLSQSVASEAKTPVPVIDLINSANEVPEPESPSEKDTTDAQIMEWEQLIVNEVPRKFSPVVSKPNFDPSPAADTTRQQDPNTSRILERLELPKTMTMRSPTISVTTSTRPRKKPLIPYHTAGTVVTASSCSTESQQPLKPVFQKLKRKHK